MSRVKVNKIEARSGNNVAFEDPMQLKSVTTTQRDALSSPQAGDTVYNSTTGTIDFYNGSAWNATSSNTFQFNISYLVIGGGGGGSRLADPANSGGSGGGGSNNSSGSGNTPPVSPSQGNAGAPNVGGGTGAGAHGTVGKGKSECSPNGHGAGCQA